MPEDWQYGGFGLYIHWPFCQAKCPYCDFNSHVSAKIDQNRWLRAYLSEIVRLGSETQGRVLSSVFFGGGTPSLMHPDSVSAIIDAVRATWQISNSFETTLEANPTSVESGRFAGYRDAGINRVSVGIQTLNDTDLKALGRLHSVSEARAAFEIARTTFDRVSFDLIYARQGQSLSGWAEELGDALKMAAGHVSLYQLTIEKGTAFGDRHARGKLQGLPREDLAADMYHVTQEVCDRAGLLAYEISNHAIVGSESQHNLIYWRCGDYAAIGPGSHGRLTLNGTRYATETKLAPNAWLEQIDATGSGEYSRQALSQVEQVAEYIMMGLRLTEGVDLKRLDALSYTKLSNKIKGLAEIGVVAESRGFLSATPTGRPVLNAIIRELLA